MDKDEVELLLSIILENISIIPYNKIKPYISKAKEIVRRIDSNDIPFVAAVIATDNEGIWTNDKHFIRAEGIKVWTTKDIISYLSQ